MIRHYRARVADRVMVAQAARWPVREPQCGGWDGHYDMRRTPAGVDQHIFCKAAQPGSARWGNAGGST